MTPDINSGISGGRNLEKQIERQMGCMTGFLQLFDRHQMLTGKRLYSAKQLPTSPTSDSVSPSEGSDFSSTSFVKAAPPSPSSPSPEKHYRARPSPPLPLPLPVFEVKDGVKTSWKLREAPRLSLDSRAVFDVRGKLRPREIRTTPVVFASDPSDCSDAGYDHDKHRRSPSVVARLMGLDALPLDCNEEQPKRSELRRSASESRVSRDLWQFNFQKLSLNSSEELFRPRKVDCSQFRPRNTKPEPPRAPPDPLKRKSYFEAQEFFPEPKSTGSMYDVIEKRLRMRGIDEPAKDLETLKQILEALQLKGLLHTMLPELPSVGSLDVVNNHALPISTTDESPLILTKQTPKPLPKSAGSERLLQHRSASPRRPVSPEVIPSAKSRREPLRKSLIRPPEPNKSSRSPISSSVRRRPVNVEGPMSSQPERQVPAIHSPVASPKRPGPDQISLKRSPRIRRQKPEISPKQKFYSLAEDDAFAFSNTGILSSPSQFDFQSVSIEECRTGRGLLERCDQLLHSIAAITSSADQVAATDQQPSPVSVLDSNFLSENSSPLSKRSIDFKEQIADWEDHRKQKASPIAGSEVKNLPEKDICAGQGDDYAFVADVVRETDRRGGPAGSLFSALEQRHWVAEYSMASALHRRHVFDTVTEIVERKRNATPWAVFTCSPSAAAFAGGESSLLQEVWEELRWLRGEHVSTENVMELSGKDLTMTHAAEQEWTVPAAEMSAAVLHIERQLFKDLVADTIREMADLAGRRRATAALPRQQLTFRISRHV